MKNRRNLLYFLYNFPYGWQNEFLKGDPMEEHLLNKYEYYYERSNHSAVVILDFFFSLDREYQDKLLTWIDENYHGVTS